ncbi:helix-turn-helix domain-containing protein [Litoribrevibacter albus]
MSQSIKQDALDIGDVSKKTGLPASTLRYYEEKGLIKSNGRNGLRRLFPPNTIQRLALISLGRTAGLSLEEIGTMFTPDGPEIDRELLLHKADEIDQKIEELKLMSKGLRHTAACKAPSHFECPTFLKLLDSAGKKAPQSPHKFGK